MAVVKSDAYGHGVIPVARTALTAGAEWLGVALVEEGVELRTAGIDVPILVMCPLTPEAAPAAIEHELTVTVCDEQSADALEAEAMDLGRRAVVHLKVDTGMGRWGLLPDDVVPFAERLSRLPHVHVEGIFSHFATADEIERSFALRQVRVFREVLDALDQRGLKPEMRHMANTAATMTLPESHFDLVRNGIGIYGLYPSPDMTRSPSLKEAMRLATRIVQIKNVGQGTSLSYGRTFVTRRPSRIAVLPVGYGDGYPRLLSNQAEVLVRGSRAPVVGRVCMDAILADITDIAGAVVGDEVVLFGRQDGDQISIDEIAAKTDTINYEITCDIGKRVPRRYV